MQKSIPEKVPVQLFTSANSWFSLDYPRMWEFEVVENIPAFFDPLFGKGALQVFTVQTGHAGKMTKELSQFPFLKGTNMKEKMQLFLEAQHVPVDDKDLSAYTKNSTYCLAHEYRIENRFHLACMMLKENTFILALYNCPEEPDDEEALRVGDIINSIKILC